MATEVEKITSVDPNKTLNEDLIDELERKKNSLNNNNGKSNNRNDKKKNKKKKKKKSRAKRNENRHLFDIDISEDNTENTDDVEIEYEVETPKFDNPEYSQFKGVFEHFMNLTKGEDENNEEVKEEETIEDNKKNEEKSGSDDDNEESNSNSDSDDDKPDSIGKKKLRKMNRLTVAELKQLVKTPEVVEWVDVTASDPKLLVSLKAYRNTVPVPPHWSQKRKYLQGKRGIEKLPFELPGKTYK